MSDLPPDMKVRLSLELRRLVETAAKQNRRTLNAEISSRLEASFEQGSMNTPQMHVSVVTMDERVLELEKRITEIETIVKKSPRMQL